MRGHFIRRSIRARIVILTAVMTAALTVSGVASAHDGDPSWHATTTSCLETPASGQWSVVSSAYMTRADGFDTRGIIYTGGGDVIYGGTGSSPGYSDQWLYYRVVVGTQDATGQWSWRYGTWIRRMNELGGQTSGIDTEVETYAGSGVFVSTSYGLVPGAREDASYASGRIGVGQRTKYVYGQMWWGPIYSGNTLVFAPRYHWDPIGYINCG
jgi:hypothetical protein